MRFSGRTALVTGGASGIGRATAEKLAREGARVAVVDRDLPNAEATVAGIVAAGGEALALEGDVTQEGQVARAVEQAVAAFGRIDLLHNHAGGIPAGDGSILDVDEATIDAALAVNIKGMMLVAKHVGRSMRDAGAGGVIVNTASDLSVIALPALACYVTTKTAIPGLTRSMAVDLAQYDIRVNAVAPGFTYTAMTAGLAGDESLMTSMRATYLIDQLAQPADIAGCVAFLLSDDATFVTGAVLVADGGHVVQ